MVPHSISVKQEDPPSTLSYIKQKTCEMAREFRDKLDVRER